MLSQEGKASRRGVLSPEGGSSSSSTGPTLPAQPPAGLFLTVSGALWGSLQMSASWMAGDWALYLQAGVSLMSQSQEQGSDLIKLFLVTSSKINK